MSTAKTETPLVGAITITRQTGSRAERRPIRITLYDALSGTNVAEFEMSLRAFAEALTGLGRVGGLLHVGSNVVVGMRREIKTANVDITGLNIYSCDLAERHERLRTLLLPWCVDGWTARAEDVANTHNHTIIGARRYATIVLSRHVPGTEKDHEEALRKFEAAERETSENSHDET